MIIAAAFLLGCYCTGAVMTFLVVGFGVGLGGRDEDIWKPFAYAAVWPIMLPLFLMGRA